MRNLNIFLNRRTKWKQQTVKSPKGNRGECFKCCLNSKSTLKGKVKAGGKGRKGSWNTDNVI